MAQFSRPRSSPTGPRSSRVTRRCLHYTPRSSRVKRRVLLIFALMLLVAAAPGEAPPLYWNDFSGMETGKLPETDFLALAGTFAVKDFEGDRVLELASGPLDSFGLLFGVTSRDATGTVSARIWGATTGRR